MRNIFDSVGIIFFLFTAAVAFCFDKTLRQELNDYNGDRAEG